MNTLLRKKWLFILLPLAFIAFTNASGQTTDVKGTVTKGGTNDPLQGVTVVEVNQNDRQVNGTNTDASGNYSIKVSNPANRLRYSFIGFVTKTETIGGRTTINIKLDDDSTKGIISDVVIVGIRSESVSNGFTST